MSNSLKDTTATQSSPTALAAQPDDTAVRQHTSKHPRIVQHFLLIWLVSNIDELNDDCRNSITQIRHIVNTIETFTDVDQCVDFLTEIQHENIFMIVSGTIGQYIVPLIHNVFQLNSIYIFCEDKSSHEQWTKEWPKVKDVFIHIDSICELLKQAAHQCDQNAISMSIIQPNEVSIQNFQQIDQSFMYTQLIKDVVFEFPYNEGLLKALIIFCRDLYVENSHELNIIDKFEREYELQSPIWWYTRGKNLIRGHSNGCEWMRMDGNGCEWMGMDANGCEWVGMDANGCEWMRMDANGWEWMRMDANA